MSYLCAPQKGIFITATDTGHGKTRVGTLLSQRLFERGIKIQPRKPVESGCTHKNGHLIPEDGLQYYQAVQQTVALETITPYRLPHLVSPARAAEIENISLTLENLHQACLKNLNPGDCLVVEGAGGFYSPLSQDGNNADLARLLKLPVLLVAANRLGCINQIMLNLQAIKSQNLDLLALVLNPIEPSPADDQQNNLEVLQTLCSSPIIEFPYINHNKIPNTLNNALNALVKLIERSANSNPYNIA